MFRTGHGSRRGREADPWSLWVSVPEVIGSAGLGVEQEWSCGQRELGKERTWQGMVLGGVSHWP